MISEDIIKIVAEEILLHEQFMTLSEILQLIDLNAFKNFVKEKNYNIANVDELAQAIVYWGKTVGKDFSKFKFPDLRKIAEYMQALVFAE